MPAWLIAIIIIAGLLLFVGVYILTVYNGLVHLNERVNEAWSDIEVQLKYRADLIPNVVSTVKGYAEHESEVFANVSEEAEGELSQALGRLMMLSESYPELKANENFATLQRQLQEIEDKIQGARRFYNGGARDLNVKIKTFPTNIFARKLGFEKRDYFEVQDRAAVENAPEVKF